MTWQEDLAVQIGARLPADAVVALRGSVLLPDRMDGWSDLDVTLALDDDVALEPLFAPAVVWAREAAATVADGPQTVRVILADGRRVDLVASGPGRLVPTGPEPDPDRFLVGLAASKLGRGDRLIGMHLSLEVARRCLVQAMLLRDRDEGTATHRYGTHRDALAEEVRAVLRLPLSITGSPNVVTGLVALLDSWRTALDPDHRPDWSGLWALVERGTRAG